MPLKKGPQFNIFLLLNSWKTHNCKPSAMQRCIQKVILNCSKHDSLSFAHTNTYLTLLTATDRQTTHEQTLLRWTLPLTAINTWAAFGLRTPSKHFLTNTAVRSERTHLSPRKHRAITKDTSPVFLRQDSLSGGPLVPSGPKAADESAEDKGGRRKDERMNCLCERETNGVLFFTFSVSALLHIVSDSVIITNICVLFVFYI